MKELLHKKLLSYTEKLRTSLSNCSTETIVGMCSSYFLKFPENRDEEDSLLAPTKQLFFMLGIMLTTPEPTCPKDFGDDGWNDSKDLLNRIFSTYAWMYWPTKDELPNLTNEWKQLRQVAMPAFLHYFSTSLMASVEQLRERIRRYVTPFDSELKKISGITATDALEITNWIADSLQSTIDKLQEEFQKENKLRLNLLDRAEREAWPIEKIREEAQKEPYISCFQQVMIGLQSMMTIQISSLVERFGKDTCSNYCSLFVSTRGKNTDFLYLTEKNPAEGAPLIRLDDNRVMCPSANMLFYAVFLWGETTLIHSEVRNTYLKHRDMELENEVFDELRNFFGKSAQLYGHIFETPKAEFEHDILLVLDRKLAIIEAKASPPVEPFRDPEKAFVRIHRAFKSDRGIQKASEQANRIRKRLLAHENVMIYSESGKPIINLEPKDFDFILPMCVTRDDFGPLTVDLSLLLQLSSGDEYPWAINILDLHNLFEAWRHLDCTPNKFFDYAGERTLLNGRLLCFDELEIAGFDIHHNGLKSLIDNKADRVHLNPSYSQIFDEIYRAIQIGEKVKPEVTQPHLTDVRELMKQIKDTNNHQEFSKQKKTGRNDPCPCGSGIKYKRCHGK